MVNNIVRLGGIHDIVRGFTKLHQFPILFVGHDSADRYCAYWIITYGSIRVFGDTFLVKLSYLIEALGLMNDIYIGHSEQERTLCIIVMCCILAYLA